MLKGVGLALVCLSCVLLGVSRKQKLRREVEIIKSLSELLVELREEIAFGKYPLAECFFRMGARGEGQMREMLLAIYEELKGSKNHPLLVFLEFLEAYLKKNGVSPSVQKELLSCMVIGNMEEDMQYKLLEQSQKRLERFYEAQKQISKEKEKLAVTLGVMGGCFFFLLFI